MADNVCKEEQCTTEQVEECNTVNDLQYESVVDEECEVETVCDIVETEERYTKHEKEWICEATEEVEEKSDNRGEQQVLSLLILPQVLENNHTEEMTRKK